MRRWRRGATLGRMKARLIQMHTQPESFDGIMAAIRERVAPSVRQLPGFKADYFAGDKGQGRLVSFVLFESGEGVAAAEALFDKLRPAVEQQGVSFDSIENLELLLGA